MCISHNALQMYKNKLASSQERLDLLYGDSCMVDVHLRWLLLSI